MRHSMSKDTTFHGETTPRHTFLCSESQCLPPGDPRILCAKHGYPITGKSFIAHRENGRGEGWGGGRGVRAKVLSPYSPLVSLRFFFFVNFSPALYYLNAWNKLSLPRFTYLGLVPRKMVKLNPGLSQILSKAFLSKNI